MAGQLKEVRNRIKSIQSTQQITKAMKMISATKLRKAQEAIQQMRPYSRKLQQVLNNIAGNADGDLSSSFSAAMKSIAQFLARETSSTGA